MPYLKFASDEDREKAWDIGMRLAEENGGTLRGLTAAINDPRYHRVDFYSAVPYLEAFDGEELQYQIIAREKISSPFAEYLRQNHPEYAEEL